MILIALISVGVSTLNKISRELEQLSTLSVPLIDLSEIQDGTYLGVYQTTAIEVKVEVTVYNHEITSILILEHRSGQGQPAEDIINHVIEQQSIDIDLISGATYSSKVILLAIGDALNQ
jgi:uncharacterized protein with FMN-binding domain